jgi:cation diffusion facilitator CzcD-associated flavoprotein CzcO
MFTFGYPFRPWESNVAIADGESICTYIRETAEAYGISRKTRFRHRVRSAAWSSADALWTIDVERGAERRAVRLTCNFLFGCTGYYDYASSYAPEFPGAEKFTGRIVHPQHWPQTLDYAGKRVVVIGSGATAVTIVPVLAEKAAHVTMLQRSPTYILSRPSQDALTGILRRRLPTRIAYAIVRWYYVLFGIYFFTLCQRTRPEGQDRLSHLPGHRTHRLSRSRRHPRKRPGHGWGTKVRPPPGSTTAPAMKSRLMKSSGLRSEQHVRLLRRTGRPRSHSSFNPTMATKRAQTLLFRFPTEALP